MADLEGFVEVHPLNSRLVKRDGSLVEEIYRVGGKYDRQIRDIVSHLQAAVPYATPAMATALEALIRFYQTGAAADRIAYDVAWVQDRHSPVDTINGFVEVYMDPRGMKGSWEALVYYVNPEKTEGIRRLAEAAQWFEDRMPWDDRYKKQGVRGISANAIDVVIETGDSGPVTPVGINLPNDQTIREEYGSKSVSLSNVSEAYRAFDRGRVQARVRVDQRGGGSSREVEQLRQRADHQHARSDWPRLGPDFRAPAGQSAVVAQGAVLRARRVARRPRGPLFPSRSQARRARVSSRRADHQEIVRAEYEAYARNALVQLRRVREGTQIEEDHMRNRQMIVGWLMANSSGDRGPSA